VIFVTARRDREHGVTVGERPPQRALGALQAPAGLVDVQRVGAADAVKQIGVGLGERIAGAGEDRVDRAGRDRR
jgi:hypothetical protein